MAKNTEEIKRARTLVSIFKRKKIRLSCFKNSWLFYLAYFVTRENFLKVSLCFVLKPNDNLRFSSSFHIHLAVLKAGNLFIHQLQDTASCHWISRWVLHPLTGIMEPSPSKLIQGNNNQWNIAVWETKIKIRTAYETLLRLPINWKFY